MENILYNDCSERRVNKPLKVAQKGLEVCIQLSLILHFLKHVNLEEKTH